MCGTFGAKTSKAASAPTRRGGGRASARYLSGRAWNFGAGDFFQGLSRGTRGLCRRVPR